MDRTECRLWTKAREMAARKGLNTMQVACIFAQACSGLTCNVLHHELTTVELDLLGQQRLNRFYMRLEQTEALRNRQLQHSV